MASKYKIARVSFSVQLYPKIEAAFTERCREIRQTKTTILNNLIKDYLQKIVIEDYDKYADEVVAIHEMLGKYVSISEPEKLEMQITILELLKDSGMFDKLVELDKQNT